MSAFIIAEAGVNHDGKLDQAIALVDAAVEARADAVKFQTFKAEALASASAPRAKYQDRNTGDNLGQLEMLRRLELDDHAHQTLQRHCERRGIAFMSSPFDLGSLTYLVNVLELDTIKLGSGELTNAPLLRAVGRSGRRLILSTGMSDLDEIGEALAVLSIAYENDTLPTAAARQQARERGFDSLRDRVTLLHCTTEYPAPYAETNLRAMDTLRQAFHLPVGFSDHTDGIAVATAAVALGACVVEKHITLDRNLPGPDHKASLEPGHFAALVSAVRQVEMALGNGVKQVAPSERANMAVARKSMVTLTSIPKGEALTLDNVGVMRPGTGASPMTFWDRLGQRADRDYAAGEVLSP